MTNHNLFLDIHVIQAVPPSNINRDDTGSPKTAQYGGVTRARVSSQSWKKAIRDYFNTNGLYANVGIRSLDIIRYIADKIQEKDSSKTEDDAIKLASDTLDKAGVKSKDNRLKALFFIGSDQAEKLAEAAIDGIADKKELHAILKNNPAIDIALFGRMVADDPSLNEDASAQVAHAISTHAVQTEFDFFTATDDLAREDNAGAGMLGTIEYNSSTLYRYANVAAHELVKRLEDNKEATKNALMLFVESFVKSMPTGKVNTFANQTLPSAVVVTLRSDRPVNIVTAFEMPVKTNGGYIENSVKQLEKGLKDAQTFVATPLSTLSIGLKENNQSDFNALLEQLGKVLEENL
ncbi:type I-E CRISPR-associated protein Cas7/Cse4/CasC [Lactococcus raffinolactis]|jgi:CRISPR system Cascade subunit CasC|uniref:Type I-E CRISPR-associated protein Cas7/Cse4/CasC n=1 Tax=Pseudolactococcus raffinolactis TaxID=1366 RepID=A0AAE6YM87_9LACT|nr:type I-E CRISPR-associated protein Cas7/Cse4/CasC [Lactococcus raffinolactis]NBK97489.1 type I-E CRISPR-associated protein Cas7/Cse4/CasC [Erysipelotrichia bacterium]QIW59064.1 type I-E CRISPR-associated protein Cas7/Cse4/CasC [Lactococcus raffinolactis]